MTFKQSLNIKVMYLFFTLQWIALIYRLMIQAFQMRQPMNFINTLKHMTVFLYSRALVQFSNVFLYRSATNHNKVVNHAHCVCWTAAPLQMRGFAAQNFTTHL